MLKDDDYDKNLIGDHFCEDAYRRKSHGHANALPTMMQRQEKRLKFWLAMVFDAKH